MRAFVVGACFSKVILRPPSPPGVIGDDDVLCMALIGGTGEMLCSTDTPPDRLLPELRSIAAVKNRLLCDCGGGGCWCCCCELALVMIEGDDLIEGECRSRIEWAAFWITWLGAGCWMTGLDRLVLCAFSSCSEPDRCAICWYRLDPGGI